MEPARRRHGSSARTSSPESLEQEISLVYQTANPKPLAYTPSCGWWTLIVILGLIVVTLIVVLALVVTLMVRGDSIRADVDKLSAFLGVQITVMAQLQSAGTSVFNALQAGVVLNPIPPLQYLTLPNTETRMAYRSRGNCQDNETHTIIYVHDLGLSSAEWISQLNHMALEHCTIAIDLLGHGFSDLASSLSGGSIQAQATYLHGFLVSSGLLAVHRPIHLVGSGFGGSVAMQYLAIHPGIIDKIIVVNPYPVMINPDNQTDLGAMKDSSMPVTFAGLAIENQTDYAINTAKWLLEGDICKNTPQAQAIQNTLVKIMLAADANAISDGWLSWSLLDHRGVYAEASIPLQLIVGANSYGVGYDAVKLACETRKLVGKGTALHVLGGAGHMPHLTHEHEFNFLEHDFIDGLGNTCGDIHPDLLVSTM